MQINIKKLKKGAKVPKYHHPGDAGVDLYSMEEVTVKPGEHHFFWHGFALEFPEGYAAIIMDKGSIAKAGFVHLGGVFDAGYRGEYNTCLVNLSKKPYTFEVGDKVSQLVIIPIVTGKFKEVKKLSESARGEGRFGSTGRK